MLAMAELAEDFAVLGQQYKKQIRALLDAVGMPGVSIEVGPTDGGNFRGYDGKQFYLVEQGSLVVRYQQRSLYRLDEGDLLLPDIAGERDAEAAVYYGSDHGATLSAYPALEFMRRVFDDPSATRQWTRLLVTYAGLMLRVAAAFVPEDTGTAPGFEVYEPGDIIIRQGEHGDFVYHMSSGVAEALVDEVVVGRIGKGEIFGAMAALTDADRSATVRAKTACSVVKVPREQFTELIKRNPSTIHSLLVDMANTIVNMNQQLVSMQR